MVGPASARHAAMTSRAARETCEELRREAEEVVCLSTPKPFMAVGVWYVNFGQTTDAEVCRLLEVAARVPDAVAKHWL